MGFVRDLVKLVPSGFVETALEHVGFFFVVWFLPRLRMRFVRCACLDGCKRLLHCPVFSYPKLVIREKRSTK